MDRIASLGARLVDLLLPPLCLHCGAALSGARPGFCPGCLATLAPLSPVACRRCGLPRPGSPDSCGRCGGWPEGLSAVAGTRYRGVARTLVAGLKYSGWRHLAEPCAVTMADALTGPARIELLVPVPLHPARRRERGFNQSRAIADALGRRLDLPVEDALVRERPTTSQVGLGRAARRANVAGAFLPAPPARRAAGAVVGLVDDVATSGATLAAAAEPLLESGARAVVGATFALAFEFAYR
ncbi:MAG: ComF family protein [Gemmatimonadetes bacterium]|nr:ComF family protein [Gemmatimonadota bacterium]